MDERGFEAQREAGDGRRAQELLAGIDPYLETMRDSLLEAFEAHPATDVSGLQAIRLQLGAVTALRHNIQQVIDTGKLAEVEMEQTNGH